MAPGSITRNAPVVPTVSAIRAGETQPLPTLAAAPSPTAGRKAAEASAGHRRAKSGERPRRLSL